jgi:hypothetical protein
MGRVPHAGLRFFLHPSATADDGPRARRKNRRDEMPTRTLVALITLLGLALSNWHL